MQCRSWDDGQADTVADIYFTYNRQAIWITRCGTIHANGQTRHVTIYHHHHGCQNMNIVKMKPPIV